MTEVRILIFLIQVLLILLLEMAGMEAVTMQHLLLLHTPTKAATAIVLLSPTTTEEVLTIKTGVMILALTTTPAIRTMNQATPPDHSALVTDGTVTDIMQTLFRRLIIMKTAVQEVLSMFTSTILVLRIRPASIPAQAGPMTLAAILTTLSILFQITTSPIPMAQAGTITVTRAITVLALRMEITLTSTASVIALQIPITIAEVLTTKPGAIQTTISKAVLA